MVTDSSNTQVQTGWLSPAETDARLFDTPPEVSAAITCLADAQVALAAALGEYHKQPPTVESIETLLNEAQITADQIVERAELEALTIRRLMRIEAERFVANVERLKERAAHLEQGFE
jgi:hypothetical protein